MKLCVGAFGLDIEIYLQPYNKIDFLLQWLALSFPAYGVYLDSVREIYQAYVVYNFITYLITFLTNEYDMDTRMKEKPQVKSPPPCCCFKPGKNEL